MSALRLNQGRAHTLTRRRFGSRLRSLFSSVQNIEELEYGELVLQCASRDYTFKAADENTCHTFVQNLRQLRERDLELRQRTP